ncbi:ligase-associated DNA damage response endonuclease PdeM [Aggregicoccus sp. 17bor-14]|nr:ligase-associated DNA damage response endonuclease PdeM [Aggregicoccus sp. 17bor-14]
MKGEALELLAARALYWPAGGGGAGVLAVADLHWGKTESFHQHGIALPTGVLQDDLQRLSAALQGTGARRLLLLGDLVHSRAGLTPAVVSEAAAWRARHPEVQVVLVRGNHDRHVPRLPEAWGIEDVPGPLDEGPFRFAHHPEPAEGRYAWAGHLHPTVRLGGGADRLRLPCFHLGREVGVLPAFSAFTGGQDVTRRAGERVYAVAGSEVVRV